MASGKRTLQTLFHRQTSPLSIAKNANVNEIATLPRRSVRVLALVPALLVLL